ncbi:hypothetical protein ATB53_09515 [Xanthomonas translucens]|uniref:Uncharacterized protein n=1 Tax=Xanthomonas campestris pv. translucens TaxID=343 RepID=A0A109HQD2_XANCT|nr:hypothetical protein ATB53_09515 [Xanthomonas translucens]
MAAAMRRRLVATLDALIDFFAMHRDVLRCGDTNTHLIALDPEHCHGDQIADHQGFAYPASQDQHF